MIIGFIIIAVLVLWGISVWRRLVGMNENVNQLIAEIESIDVMLNQLSDANNQIVDNITNLSATTEEVTASSSQAADMTIENLDHAESAKEQLNNVLDVSHQLDKYM